MLGLREAAKLIGISHTRLASLETGLNAHNQKTKPTLENLIKIANTYELSIVELVKLSKVDEYRVLLDELMILKDDERKLLECYRDLSRHKKAEILAMLQKLTNRDE